MVPRRLLILLAVTSMLAGCSSAPAVSSGDRVASVPISFNELFASRFSPPGRFGDLHGLALYNTAVEPGPAHPEGARFVVYALINNRSPLQGVLVGTQTPMTLSFFRERHNASTIMSGAIRTFPSPELVSYFLDHHGIHLATNSAGQPYWIDGTEATTANPAAARTSTPPPSPREPASAPHPDKQENEPFDRELVFTPVRL